MKTQIIKKVEETIAQKIRAGKTHIHYSELVNTCEISPTYAREILRSYAFSNNFNYSQGYLNVV